MCEPTTIAMAAMVIGGGMQAYGQYQQGYTDKGIAKNNATMAGYASADAQRRGDEEAAKVHRAAMALRSAQRAGFAGKGIDVSYGSAADIQDQTGFFGEMDEQTARYNADMESWQHRVQQQNFKAQAQGIHPLLTATGTLLTTAGAAYSMGAKPTIGAGAGQGTSAQYFKSIGTPGFKYPI